MLFEKTFMKELISCGFVAGFIGREIVFCRHWKLVCGQLKVREIFIIVICGNSVNRSLNVKIKD